MVTPFFVLSHNETRNAESSARKPFAVFVAHFNPQTAEAKGGIAGSAFFISPTKAMTAFHVLNSKSFQKNSSNDLVKVWLVSENQRAIEIRASLIVEHADWDITAIDFGDRAVVNENQVYALSATGLNGERMTSSALESDGFYAQTTGPQLFFDGKDLLITATPHLARLHKSGPLVQTSLLTLISNDVNLQNKPCLQVKYQPVVGLSGGPITSNGQIVAINSFADPAKDSTWGIQLNTPMVAELYRRTTH